MLFILRLVLFGSRSLAVAMATRASAVGWSPAGVILLVLVLMFFTGHLSFGS